MILDSETNMKDSSKQIRKVKRKEAQSGRCSYAEPTVLYHSRKTKIVFIPFFIPSKSSEGTHLTCKIQTYRIEKPLGTFSYVEDKSVSLDEEATRKLFSCLKDSLAISGEDEDGNFIVIRVADGKVMIDDIDPKVIVNAVIGILEKKEIVSHLKNRELNLELISVFRGAIRIQELRNAVAALQNYLDSGEENESVYQKWCEEHSWAFGTAYLTGDKVKQISSGDKLDLLLPTVMAGYRDIVELKKPNMKVLNYDSEHKNYYFASEVSKAIGQCHRYLDIFQEVADKGLLDHPEIVSYHPRSIIVIGRSKDWEEDKLRSLHGLNCRLSRITVMTYDQLLAQGERLLQIVGESFENEKEPCDDEDL